MDWNNISSSYCDYSNFSRSYSELWFFKAFTILTDFSYVDKTTSKFTSFDNVTFAQFPQIIPLLASQWIHSRNKHLFRVILSPSYMQSIVILWYIIFTSFQDSFFASPYNRDILFDTYKRKNSVQSAHNENPSNRSVHAHAPFIATCFTSCNMANSRGATSFHPFYVKLIIRCSTFSWRSSRRDSCTDAIIPFFPVPVFSSLQPVTETRGNRIYTKSVPVTSL